MKQSQLFAKILRKVKNRKTTQPFNVKVLRPILDSSPSFLSKHRLGNPQGNIAYFKRSKRGSYRILNRYLKGSFQLLILLLFNFASWAQSKSIEEVYSDGKPKKIIYELNGALTKEEFLSEDGKILKFYNYNPKNGLKEGAFLDESGEGTFKDDNLDGFCSIKFDHDRGNGEMIRRGQWVKGKPIGVHKILRKLIEETGTSLNKEVSYYVGRAIYMPYTVYSKYYAEVATITFSASVPGKLDGKTNLLYGVISTNKSIAKNPYADLIYNDGSLLKITRYDTPKRIIDSVSFYPNSDSIIGKPLIYRQLMETNKTLYLDEFGNFFQQNAYKDDFYFTDLFKFYLYEANIRVNNNMLKTDEKLYKFNNGRSAKEDIIENLDWESTELNQSVASNNFPKYSYIYTSSNSWHPVYFSWPNQDWIKDDQIFFKINERKENISQNIDQISDESYAKGIVTFRYEHKSVSDLVPKLSPSILFYKEDGSEFHISKDQLYFKNISLGIFKYDEPNESYSINATSENQSAIEDAKSKKRESVLIGNALDYNLYRFPKPVINDNTFHFSYISTTLQKKVTVFIGLAFLKNGVPVMQIINTTENKYSANTPYQNTSYFIILDNSTTKLLFNLKYNAIEEGYQRAKYTWLCASELDNNSKTYSALLKLSQLRNIKEPISQELKKSMFEVDAYNQIDQQFRELSSQDSISHLDIVKYFIESSKFYGKARSSNDLKINYNPFSEYYNSTDFQYDRLAKSINTKHNIQSMLDLLQQVSEECNSIQLQIENAVQSSSLYKFNPDNVDQFGGSYYEINQKREKAVNEFVKGEPKNLYNGLDAILGKTFPKNVTSTYRLKRVYNNDGNLRSVNYKYLLERN